MVRTKEYIPSTCLFVMTHEVFCIGSHLQEVKILKPGIVRRLVISKKQSTCSS
jgi:hypothetical protein